MFVCRNILGIALFAPSTHFLDCPFWPLHILNGAISPHPVKLCAGKQHLLGLLLHHLAGSLGESIINNTPLKNLILAR